jgi:protein-histidine N-methyltransferase
MAFSFGFSGDDIEEDPNDASNARQDTQMAEDGGNGPPPIEARTHDLDEMVGNSLFRYFPHLFISNGNISIILLLSKVQFLHLPNPIQIQLLTHELPSNHTQLRSLPSKLSYNILSLSSPHSHTCRLPRRELFDVRLQLMSEDDGTNSTPLAGLQSSDLTTNVYEGGYKTWECSLDLVRFLMDRGPRKDIDDLCRVDHVIEMGCGTALPSLLLFMYCLKNGLRMQFTLMDYNDSVLRLVTLPNLILAWAATLPANDPVFSSEDRVSDSNPLADETAASGDLELTPNLLSAFKSSLSSQGITLTLISGSWLPVPALLSLIPSTPEMNTFILASETIYSPASSAAFTEAMVGLIKRVKSGKAVVAAKRVYFGVGGSVDAFREEVSRHGCVGYEMEFEGLESDGVRRCLLEVQMC